MNKKLQENNKLIAFPIHLFSNGERDSFEEQKVDSEIHVVPTGEWEHPYYGKFSITTDSISEMVKNFKEGVRKDLPITPGHDNGMSGGELPAVGWFKELIDKGVNGLYAYVEWTEEGLRLLKQKAFKYFSAEISYDYKDVETGTERSIVLVGGALTNKPFFKQLNMDPINSFSEEDKKKVVVSFEVPEIINQFSENIMDLKTIVAKKVEELSDEEKAFLKEHKEELSPEESESFKSVIEEAEGETPEAKEEREKKEKDEEDEGVKAEQEATNVAAGLNPDGTPKATDVNASEAKKEVTLSQAEHMALKARADLADKLFAEAEKLKVNKLVSLLVLSETNKAGKFSVAQKGAVESFIVGLSEKQRDQFQNIINNMPTKAVDFSEVGDGGSEVDASVTALAKKADALAKDKMKENPKFSYSEALRAVFRENPDLAKDYESGN